MIVALKALDAQLDAVLQVGWRGLAPVWVVLNNRKMNTDFRDEHPTAFQHMS